MGCQAKRVWSWSHKGQSEARFSKNLNDEFTTMNMLIFERPYDDSMILSYDKVMTNLSRFYDHLIIFQKSGT